MKRGHDRTLAQLGPVSLELSAGRLCKGPACKRKGGTQDAGRGSRIYVFTCRECEMAKIQAAAHSRALLPLRHGNRRPLNFEGDVDYRVSRITGRKSVQQPSLSHKQHTLRL